MSDHCLSTCLTMSLFQPAADLWLLRKSLKQVGNSLACCSVHHYVLKYRESIYYLSVRELVFHADVLGGRREGGGPWRLPRGSPLAMHGSSDHQSTVIKTQQEAGDTTQVAAHLMQIYIVYFSNGIQSMFPAGEPGIKYLLFFSCKLHLFSLIIKIPLPFILLLLLNRFGNVRLYLTRKYLSNLVAVFVEACFTSCQQCSKSLQRTEVIGDGFNVYISRCGDLQGCIMHY